MSPPRQSHKTDPAQGTFDWAVGYQHRQFLTIDEVARILHLNRNTVISLCDAMKLEWHEHTLTGERNLTRRITRRSVVAYLAATAKYKPADWGETLLCAIRETKDPALLSQIAALAESLAERL